MATLTPDSVELQDFGQVEVREAELDGYSVSFLHVKQPVDMARMLHGLPGDQCTCPHWGIVTDGHMTVRYPDHEEVVHAGDVFYMVPGHIPEYEVGTRLIFFSPTDEMEKVNEVIMRNAQTLMGT
jgi:glyoxylase-like metal-dependent hydrolase (beta-lactamase superfamily II)